MRRLINYFRQCFCKHDFIVEEIWKNSTKTHVGYREHTQNTLYVYMRCNKCGYHNSHTKI